MRVCIIPCALEIRIELQYQFGNIPSVLIPLENKPFFEYIYSSLNKYIDYFVIVTCPSFVNLISSRFPALADKLFVVPCENTADLLTTIKTGYDFISGQFINFTDVEIVVNFGDTYIDHQRFDFQNDFVFYSNVNDNTEWTSFSLADGKICDIIDKKTTGSGHILDTSVFCGLFFFKDTKSLKELWGNAKDIYGEFYRVLSEYSLLNRIDFIKSDRWIDIGHLKEYYQSKRTIASRYFNTIEVDERRGILTKKTSENKKLVNEINWYMKLPSSLRHTFPAIYDYSLDIDMPYLKMEYLPYPTLHELYVFAELPIFVWKNITMNLLLLLDDFAINKKDVTSEEFYDSVKAMYIDKTLKRVGELQKAGGELYDLYKLPLVINNVTFMSAEYYVNNLTQILTLSGVFSTNALSVIHGDFCATNILCDIKYNILKLIDPRGSFGSYDIYGDPIYDIAKLLHSFDGKYDFIVADRFKFDLSDNTVEYSFDVNNIHTEIDSLIISALHGKYGDDFYKAKLVEGILFVSMLPLHKDKPQRQKVMLCRGIELLDYAYKHYGILEG